jgi:hypothetical protein
VETPGCAVGWSPGGSSDVGTDTGGFCSAPPFAGLEIGVAVADDDPLSQPVETNPVAMARSAIRKASFLDMNFNVV